MAQIWKIKREWARFQQQLRSIPEALYEPLLQRRHDAARPRFPMHEGQITAQGKIALFLTYQPKGVGAECIAHLQALVDAGYAPLVIANADLSEKDIKELAPVSWRILDRPNFGYDFGGYRDGLLWLIESGETVEALLILNDSVLFPVTDASILNHPFDPAALSGGILRSRGEERFLESYFYHVPKAVFTSEPFRNYWQSYKLTSNKYKVIRRGERGFSQEMLEGGVQLSALYSNRDFVNAFVDQQLSEQHKILSYRAYRDPKHEEEAAKLLKAESSELIAHVKHVLSKDVFNSAYGYGAITLLNFPFLKKSNDRVNQKWRKVYLRAVENGDLPAPNAVISDWLAKAHPKA